MRNQAPSQSSIARSAISCILVLITQFSLLIVPRYFSSLQLTAQLFLSGVVLVFVAGVGKLCKRLLRVRASAPAFVFFTVLFVWAVYLAAVRPAISPLGDILLNGELILLAIGFFSDPGFVKVALSNAHNTMELDSSAIGLCSTLTSMERRVRFCKTCDAFVRGYDHHCPAFGNCIGQENHLLFIVLLGGFIAVEISYVVSVHEVARNFQSLSDRENNLKESFAISTMFSVIQVTWQVVFLAWHLYCICFNIKTNEWINWRKYPEFQIVSQNSTGESFTDMRFTNPYDRGILCNLKELLTVHLLLAASPSMLRVVMVSTQSSIVTLI